MRRPLSGMVCVVLLCGLVGCLPTGSDPGRETPDRAAEVFEPDCGVEGVCTDEWRGGGPAKEIRRLPLPDAPVLLQSMTAVEVQHEIRSDAEGKFRIKVKPGKYRVTAPESFPSRWYRPEITHGERVTDVIEVVPGKFTRIGVTFIGGSS